MRGKSQVVACVGKTSGYVVFVVVANVVFIHFLVGCFFHLVTIEVDVSKVWEFGILLVANMQGYLRRCALVDDIEQVEAHEVVIIQERGELRCPYHFCVLLGRFLSDGCRYVCGEELTVGCCASLGNRERSLKLCIAFYNLVVEQFREVVAQVFHIGNGIGLNPSTEVNCIDGAQTVVHPLAYDDGFLVVEVHEVLAADVEAAADGSLLRSESHLAEVRADDALVIDHSRVFVEHRQIAVNENLDICGIAHGDNLVLLGLAVVAFVLDSRVVDAVAIMIYTLGVDGGILYLLTLLVEQRQIQGVVFLIESRSEPVEVHHLPAFVLVEVEGRGNLHVVHAVVQVNTSVQLVLVNSQFLVVATHQEHIQ